MITRTWSTLLAFAALAASGLLGPPAVAQPVDDVPAALRQGGYVIVMRHAHSPRTPPEPADAEPDNAKRERQLDEVGRESATAMGEALRRLGVPIGQVLSSPTFRALETVRYLGVGRAEPVPELGDGGANMRADTEGARSRWLAERVRAAPAAGTNTLLVTHQPNIAGAFGERFADTGDGEALIFKPGGREPEVVARVPIDAWPSLAQR